MQSAGEETSLMVSNEQLRSGVYFCSRAEEIETDVIELRRDFHMHPETAYQEVRTSARVCEELDKLGIPYVRIEHNMVIATITGGAAGKQIGIRADMDALPMQEESEVPYASKTSGAMHSCGHDGHTAMLLGVGRLLNEVKESLHGTVKLIFQSAEEVGGGVPEIISHLDQCGGLDRLIAIHLWADIDAGRISVEPGGRMAGGILFDVTVHGSGGHGSRPDKTHDPIKPACEILLQLAAIPGSRFDILQPCVVSPAMIQGGTTYNIIPDTAHIKGTIRYFSYEAGEVLSQLASSIVENTAKAYGVTADIQYSGHVLPIVNQEEAAELGKTVVKKIDGLEAFAFEPICACDCFGDLLHKYPGVYCYLGVRNAEKNCIYPQHHNKYNIDESVLKNGCAYLAQYAYDFLNEGT